MLFDRSLPIFSMTSIKRHIEYFNFRCQIQLDLPVLSDAADRRCLVPQEHEQDGRYDAHDEQEVNARRLRYPLVAESPPAKRIAYLETYQSPEFKFRFVLFRLQMLCFSALCGQIW